MRIKDLLEHSVLQEMPVRNFELKGDFGAQNKRGSFHRATDRKLLRHPKMEASVRKMFSRFGQTIDVCIMNDEKIADSVFNSEFSRKDANSSETFKYVFGTYPDPEAITIVTLRNGAVNNYTNGVGPMSPWMFVHRFWQSINDMMEPTPFAVSVNKMIERIDKASIGLFGYGVTLSSLPFTFRSARESKILLMDDLVFELLTQYCLAGEIKMRSYEDALELARSKPDFDEPKSNVKARMRNYRSYVKYINKIIPALAHDTMKSFQGKAIFVI